MLLAGGQGEHEAALAIGIHRLAAQPARHLADMLLAAGEQAEIGPAKQQAGAERLALAHHDVGTHLARRFHRAQRDDLGDDNDQQRAGLVAGLGQRGEIGDVAEQIGVLHDNAAGLAVDGGDQRIHVVAGRAGGEHRGGGLHHVTGKAGERLQHRGVMRVDAGRDEAFCPPRDAPRHEHRLGHRGGAIIHGGVGHLHAGQAGNLGLEFEQHLQGALRDFRLIGRVGGEEFAALDHHVDGGRHMMLVGAAAHEEGRRAGGAVLRRHLHQRPLHRHLAGVVRQAGDRAGQAGGFGHIDEQIIDAGGADCGQHG